MNIRFICFQCAYAEFCNLLLTKQDISTTEKKQKREGDNESKRESEHVSKKRKKKSKKKER